jgi:hypothetical protein
VINAVFFVFFLLLPATSFATENNPKPWRLSDGSGPLQISGGQLLRYESLNGQYRAGRSGSDQVLLARSNVRAELTFNAVDLGIEVLDARQALADRGTPLSSGLVNTAAVQQLYTTLRLGDVLQAESKVDVRIGRQTLDLGSRRLVARSDFSTAPTSFTGAVVTLNTAGGNRTRIFHMAPVQNNPQDIESLLSNTTEVDRLNHAIRVTGIYTEYLYLSKRFITDLFLIRVSEKHSERHPNTHRTLNSAGFRLFRTAVTQQIDFQLESVLQWGHSHANAAPAEQGLRHRAGMVHAELGYSFSGTWRTRLQLQLDYATGDDNPGDKENNRYDTLYGDRRFDFGPTGIYGPFSRPNLISLGYRVSATPFSNTRLMLSHRAYQLESARDAWAGSGLRDSRGKAGRDLGQQLEVRLQWDVLPGNLMLEGGAAWLNTASFARRASAGTAPSESQYAYLQSILSF